MTSPHSDDGQPMSEPSILDSILDEIQRRTGGTRRAVRGLLTDRRDVDQASLVGSLDDVRKVMAVLPNDFDDRDTFVRIAAALRASLPEHQEEALELFSDWAEKWEGGENDPEYVDATFWSVNAPYGVGFQYLVGLAGRHGDVSSLLDVLPDDEGAGEADELPWITATEWKDAAVPARRWIVEGLIPHGEVTLLYGSGGVGKTLLAQQIATCVAAGTPFFGHEVAKGRVMMFAGEDSADELHIRQNDICAGLAVDMGALEDLRILSRKFMDNIFMLWDRATSAPKKQAIWKQLVRDAKRWGARLVVVDTIADTFGGSEIDRQQVRQFVQMVLGKLAEEIDGAVLALGHPSKSGEMSGDGTSGSTAWNASVRSRLFLRYVDPKKPSDFRHLETMKSNYGPAGGTMLLRWTRGSLELVASKGRGTPEAGPLPSTDDACQAAVIEAVVEAGAAPMSLKRQARSYAPKVLKHIAARVLEAFTLDEVDEAIRQLVQDGKVVEAVVGLDKFRKPVHGLKTECPENIFD